ncbi:hypothetical protein D3C78_1998290 [compost metagenome]
MLGLLFAGVLADQIGVEKIFLIGGVVVMLTGLFLITIRVVQQLEDPSRKI